MFPYSSWYCKPGVDTSLGGQIFLFDFIALKWNLVNKFGAGIFLSLGLFCFEEGLCHHFVHSHFDQVVVSRSHDGTGTEIHRRVHGSKLRRKRHP